MTIPQDFLTPKTYVDTAVADVPKHVSIKYSTGLGLATLTGAIKDNFPGNATLSRVVINPGSVLPVGSAVIIDVKVNGGSIYVDNTHRPQLAPGVSTSVVSPASNAIGGGQTFAATDQVSIDIVQVGSTTPGTGITVSIDAVPTS